MIGFGQIINKLGGDIDGEAAGDRSGASVSLSSDGMTVAIGAMWNSGNGDGSGHVRIYSWERILLRVKRLQITSHSILSLPINLVT